MSPPTVQLCRGPNSLSCSPLPSLSPSSFINQPLLEVLQPPNPSTHLAPTLLGFSFLMIIKIPFLPLCCSSCSDSYSRSLSQFLPLSLMFLLRHLLPPVVLRHWSPLLRSAGATSHESSCSNKRLWDANCQRPAGQPLRAMKSLKHWEQKLGECFF